MTRYWKFLTSATVFLIVDAVAITMAVSKQGMIAGALAPFMIGAWVLMMKYS